MNDTSRNPGSDAQAAVERVLKLCAYLDTSACNMAGKITSGLAGPDLIRAAVDGSERWRELEARIPTLPPGGVSAQVLSRIANIAPNESIDLGGGVILSVE